MRFERFVGLRYLLAARRHGFLSVITWLSILGVAIGVCCLIMVIAVMAGFEKDLRDKILGLDAHLVVTSPSGIQDYDHLITKIRTLPDVRGVSPYLEGEILVSTERETRGAVLRGIDPETAGSVLDLAALTQGSCRDMKLSECLTPQSGGLPRLLIGSELALDLKAAFDTHRNLNLISPLGRLGPLGFEPQVRTFTVTDTFKSGFYDYDSHFVYATLSEAQRFFGSPGRITGIEVNIADLNRVDAVKSAMIAALGDDAAQLKIEHWQERNKNLFSALKLEKIVMFLVLMLIIVVASLVILVTLSMLVLEKKAEIAVLRTLGVSRKKIARIFVLDGALIGTAGAILGFGLGLGLCLLLDRYHFVELPPQYYVTTIPVVIDWSDMVLIAAASIAVAVLATWIPARQAAAIDPVEVLRYE